MQFSERISRISVSSTAAVLQKADKLRATGVKLVDFGAGEPDFPTPDHIKQAAVRALEENFTKYTPTGGTRELKEALVDRHAKDFGSHYSVEECLVTVGGKQAIFEAMVATLNDGDEVILPVPYWVSYLDIINYAGGKAVFLETDEAEDFAVRADAVEKLITPRTRMIVVNSPNNPTGAVILRARKWKSSWVWQRGTRFSCCQTSAIAIFSTMTRRFPWGASTDREHLLIVGSLSKTYAMTGWRVGFALGSSKLLANMLKLQSHSTSNPTSIAQKAAVEALRGSQDSVRAMLAEYRRRRDRVVEGLRAIPDIKCTMPQGAFYAYPNVSAYLNRDGLANTTVLAEKLLEEAHVAVVPGPAFGTQQHVRLSYATSLDQIDEGLRRMAEFFAKFLDRKCPPSTARSNSPISSSRKSGGGGIWRRSLTRQTPHPRTSGQSANPCIGEVWVTDDASRFLNGPAAGMTLAEASEKYGPELHGKSWPGRRFPLLAKYIFTSDWLSVQVHPDDAYAAVHDPGNLGKCEMWYFLKTDPDAAILLGLKPGVTKEQLLPAFKAGTSRDFLQSFRPEQEEAAFLPPGIVHALGPGLVLFEVEENSDLTYRLDDFGRPGLDGNPRPLHLEKGLEVIRPELPPRRDLPRLELKEKYGTRRLVLASRFFALEELSVRHTATFHSIAREGGGAFHRGR